MSKTGKTGDVTRALRVSNVPQDDDVQAELELELAASGRGAAVPREGLVGAHAGRRAPSTGAERQQEPTGPGADVAPTKRAEDRERERHRLERALGRTPAGEDGLIRDQRGKNVSRAHLDEAARRADRHVLGHDVPKRPS
jgi:hypothetical protein